MTSSITLSALTATMSTGSDYGTSKGHIQLIMGPMFSGKSTELIRRLKRYQIARYECLIVRYAKDNRYADSAIATHDRQSLLAVSASTTAELRDRASQYDVIGVDEGQFFPDITQFCEDMANLGKIVLVAALDGTFQRKGFQNIMELVPLAEHVVKLKAVCMNCFGDGSYTKRLSEDQEVEVIGGADKYMAVCRRCYFSNVKIPASPRIPLKAVGGTNGVSSNGHCDDDEGVSPPKKSLFVEKEKESGKENNGLAIAK